ncbi:unnamed protein product [Zymoseptoria tritici ST99CH_3D7]|uniref:Uncharacterized protein n=1 Tax=Zymoseptoria tritici (strain ST99CH_3D7) TaxID=1276538 RepID=A0A1X7RHZ4_ZYMT9|nr:unnamed protein product [Zymoseptoria tritici ST99CH_3D7]
MSPVEQKAQPWKAVWPQEEIADSNTVAVETPEQANFQRSYGTHAPNSKGKLFNVDDEQKSQPWKAVWPQGEGVDANTVPVETAEQANFQRSYGTHAPNSKGKLFTVDDGEKAQPWKAVWPQGEGVDANNLPVETAEQANFQRSYGTHAPNSKGKLFDVEDGEKAQPWKSVWPQDKSAGDAEVVETPEQANFQRSYGTHAPNSKGKLFDVKDETKGTE